ncbi:hypothetical protein ACQP1S_19495 [Micromonospora matsumotoense]|uniref:hypothetical protein n=1 Tax=Micromonospora matsumotoense TaxID=121616 RepID=UPI003D8FF663
MELTGTGVPLTREDLCRLGLSGMLAPGGLPRLTTPDLRRYVTGYLDGGDFYREHRQRLMRLGASPQDIPQRPAFMLEQMLQFHGHRWIYDLDELRYALTIAGFDPEAVTVRSFGAGAVPDVATLDREVRNDETMYVEAVR